MRAVSVLVAVLSIVSGILVDAQGQYVEAQYPPIECPPGKITEEEAYKDVTSAHPKGLMPCFCQKLHAKAPWSTFTKSFKDHDPEEEDDFPYCRETGQELVAKGSSKTLSSTSVIMINGILAYVFKFLGEYQRKPTMIEQNQTCFDQIMWMEFFNTGIVILIISMSPASSIFSQQKDQDHSFKTHYDGFESDWYAEVGKVLVITLTLNCFASSTIDMQKFFNVMVKRFKDRGYSPYLKKYPDLKVEDDDQPRTKKTAQSALEALYEGDEFDSSKALSRMMSTFLVIVFYSPGMPVLYIFGFVFFTATFLVHKILLIQFYKKTPTFTREIPLHCAKIMKYALFLKLGNGLFMFLNPRILELQDYPNTWLEQRWERHPSNSKYNKFAF